ncbi:MAG TPA: peptide MFS transporter [Gammaproteobacteria bacterium]|nr:peptide MFS transporter [Gammaproteobacteria bacterium]
MSARGFFGHPAGLATLFFTELWERFSYYGMRGLLILYMTAPLAAGGLGWDTARAGAVYGMYSGAVYLACLPGGWLADRHLGARRATWWGGWLIFAGHCCLALPTARTFFAGLALIVLGTGLLKPNVSTMVGQLYLDDDARRDAGYSLYYMGINLGAFLAPLACGWLALSAESQALLARLGLAPGEAWHFGFGAAALGMALGLVQYARGGARLGAVGLAPGQPADAPARAKLKWGLTLGGAALLVLAFALATGRLTIAALNGAFASVLLAVTAAFFIAMFRGAHWTAEERQRLVLVLLLFVGAAVFWSLFEQGGSTLNLFAERATDRVVFGWEFPATWFHSINPLLIIALAPLFALLWTRLGPRNPNPVSKFVLGLVLVAAGFGVLILAARLAADGVKVSPAWLVTTYLLHTLGELCLSPVGLSAMSRLAPARIASLTMGVWFLASAVGNYLGGRVASLYDSFGLATLFAVVTAAALLAAALLAGTLPWSRRLLGRRQFDRSRDRGEVIAD